MDWKLFIKDTKNKFANLNNEIPNTFEGFNCIPFSLIKYI